MELILFIIVTSMFEGQRLSYVVPGYTGHIPKRLYDQCQGLQKGAVTSKIPGYAGYVPSIKPQNLYGSTFGKITYSVGNDDFVRGQDFEAAHKYVSTQTMTNIAPTNMLQRTAADIVGVPNKKIDVTNPNTQTVGPEVSQFELLKDQQFRQSLQDGPKWGEERVVDKHGKQYVQLGKPLPGYTGFGKRVLANNIFGRTFAECLKEAKQDQHHLNTQKKNNFHTQYHSDPPMKF